MSGLLSCFYATEQSGTSNYIWTETYFNGLGRTTKTIKTIDSTPYTTETTYDALSRTDTIKYPYSSLEIKYEYDTGGNLLRVKNNSGSYAYATYTGYNALGQVGTITYGNGVSTQYQYYSSNNRLYSITTSKQSTDRDTDRDKGVTSRHWTN